MKRTYKIGKTGGKRRAKAIAAKIVKRESENKKSKGFFDGLITKSLKTVFLYTLLGGVIYGAGAYFIFNSLALRGGLPVWALASLSIILFVGFIILGFTYGAALGATRVIKNSLNLPVITKPVLWFVYALGLTVILIQILAGLIIKLL